MIGHEIGHILQHHQARMLYGQRGVQFTSLAALALAILASRGGGQGAQVTEAAVATAGAMNIQNQLNYTRDHEREADRVGLQLLIRAGFAPRAMVTFFERMLRANRLNEFKGAPGYLRTHPLTTERIADMQVRVENLPSRLVPDSFEYRIARAKKLRAASSSATEAVQLFQHRARGQDRGPPARGRIRPRPGAAARPRLRPSAWKTLRAAAAREHATRPSSCSPASSKADMGQTDAAAAIYRARPRRPSRLPRARLREPRSPAARRRRQAVLDDVDKRLHERPTDARLYEFQARAYEALGRTASQHRAQAEAQYRRDNLAAAVDQLELAVKVKSSDFYEQSSAEARLRELKSLLENQLAAEKALKIS